MNKSAGFSFLELMIAVFIFAIIALITNFTLKHSIDSYLQLSKQHQQLTAIQTAIHQLRVDANNLQYIPKTKNLTFYDKLQQQKVIYKLDKNNLIRQQADKQPILLGGVTAIDCTLIDAVKNAKELRIQLNFKTLGELALLFRLKTYDQ